MEKIQLKMESSIGDLYLVAAESGLKGVFWSEQDVAFHSNSKTISNILQQAESEILEYLDGRRQEFSVKCDADGTNFQKKVWKILARTNYGETRSYKDVAIELGDPNASRAVGTANGQNPLCIITPCHRIISSDGSLGGYSGGIERKKILLKLECDGVSK